MKSEVKKLDACLRELDIEVGQETVRSKLDEIYNKIAKSAKIAGFRPGTAPREILEKHHGQSAAEELVKALIPESYEKSMQEHSLFSYEPPQISDVSLKNNVLSFKAKVEVRPEINLRLYKGIKIKRKEPQVGQEDVQRQLESLAKERNRENDMTDNLARSLGYKTLEELKEFLRKQLYLRSFEESYQDILNQILEHLIKNNPISVPSILAKRQLERRLQETRYRLKAYGGKQAPEDIEAKIKELEPQIKETCQRDVKIFLLLEEIAKKENLQIKDSSLITQRAIEFLFENARWG